MYAAKTSCPYEICALLQTWQRLGIHYMLFFRDATSQKCHILRYAIIRSSFDILSNFEEKKLESTTLVQFKEILILLNRDLLNVIFHNTGPGVFRINRNEFRYILRIAVHDFVTRRISRSSFYHLQNLFCRIYLLPTRRYNVETTNISNTNNSQRYSSALV